MKKAKRALVFLLALLLLAGVAAAQENIIEGDINKAAGDLEILRGTMVNGNVTVNMGEVDILGTVNGNVSNNMGQITVHGEVNGSGSQHVQADHGQCHGDVVAHGRGDRKSCRRQRESGTWCGQIRARLPAVDAVSASVFRRAGNVSSRGKGDYYRNRSRMLIASNGRLAPSEVGGGFMLKRAWLRLPGAGGLNRGSRRAQRGRDRFPSDYFRSR